MKGKMNKLELGKILVTMADEILKKEVHIDDYNVTYKVKERIEKLTDEEYENIANDAIYDTVAMFR